MEQDIKQCQGQLSTLRANEKQAKSELAEFTSRPLLSELQQDIDRLKEEKEGLLADLAKLADGESDAISPEEQEAVEKEWKYWQKHSTVRKRICHDMWRRCTEVLPEDMTREDLKVHTRLMRLTTSYQTLIVNDHRSLWGLKGL